MKFVILFAIVFGLMVFFDSIGVLIGHSQVPQYQSSRSNMNQPNQARPIQNGLETQREEPVGQLNWATKTLGGQQFWTDVRHVGGWRVQENSETGHFRLLDPSNVRQGWGNRTHCDILLDKFVINGKAKLCSGKVVILLHGLIRTSSSMTPLAKYLHEKGGYATVNFQFASTRKSVGAHAIALKEVVDGLGPNVTEINFIGHSLGNLVVRRYLGDTTNPATGTQGDSRIKRVVMIGPPNQGSRMARILKSSLLFNTIAGVSGAQLSRGWEKLQPTLATPAMEFGIIAGGQATEKNWSNFVLKGKDDFTVSLDEAKLVGAHDLMVKPLLHSTMMTQPVVLQGALNFFRNGYFESEAKRTPITAANTKVRDQRASSTTGGSRR